MDDVDSAAFPGDHVPVTKTCDDTAARFAAAPTEPPSWVPAASMSKTPAPQAPTSTSSSAETAADGLPLASVVEAQGSSALRFQATLDEMRLRGVRLANAGKNTGKRAYAFNRLQAMTLPRAYRPPLAARNKTVKS